MSIIGSSPANLSFNDLARPEGAARYRAPPARRPRSSPDRPRKQVVERAVGDIEKLRGLAEPRGRTPPACQSRHDMIARRARSPRI